jgi:acetoin utilization deacetylase AcuC-like enzyme
VCIQMHFNGHTRLRQLLEVHQRIVQATAASLPAFLVALAEQQAWIRSLQSRLPRKAAASSELRASDDSARDESLAAFIFAAESATSALIASAMVPFAGAAQRYCNAASPLHLGGMQARAGSLAWVCTLRW